MLIFSNACDYGLRAVLYITSQKERQYVPIREISDALQISFHFLTKILQILTQKQLLISFRGPNGGVALARNATLINLMEIIVAIDGPDLFENCVLGLENCGDEYPCPLHHQWGEIRKNLQELFKSKSLKEVANEINKEGFRISNKFIEK